MFDVTALGEMLIDFTMQGTNGQGQRVFAQNAGGAPANVAAAIAKLGAKTAFIGKAGNDMHGRFLKETLESCGIDNSGFTLSDEYFTTLAFVDVKPDGEREFSFARNHGADKMLSEKDIPLELISSSRILHIGSISLTDEPCRSATLYAVKNAKENGVIVSYDPNYRASLWNSECEAVNQMRSMIPYADVMKISQEETILTPPVKRACFHWEFLVKKLQNDFKKQIDRKWELWYNIVSRYRVSRKDGGRRWLTNYASVQAPSCAWRWMPPWEKSRNLISSAPS